MKQNASKAALNSIQKLFTTFRHFWYNQYFRKYKYIYIDKKVFYNFQDGGLNMFDRRKILSNLYLAIKNICKKLSFKEIGEGKLI